MSMLKTITPEFHKAIVDGTGVKGPVVDLLNYKEPDFEDLYSFTGALNHGARFHPRINGLPAYAILASDIDPDTDFMENIRYDLADKVGVVIGPSIEMRQIVAQVALNPEYKDYAKLCEKPFQLGLKWVRRNIPRGNFLIDAGNYLSSVYAFTLLPSKD